MKKVIKIVLLPFLLTPVLLACQSENKNSARQFNEERQGTPLPVIDTEALDILFKLEHLAVQEEADLMLSEDQVEGIIPVLESWKKSLEEDLSINSGKYLTLINNELTEEQIDYFPFEDQDGRPGTPPSGEGTPPEGAGGPGGDSPQGGMRGSGASGGGPGGTGGMQEPNGREMNPDPDQFNMVKIIERTIEKLSEN